MSRRVVLVRHGSPAANHQRRFVGSTDVPIADEGRIDLTRLAGGLRDFMPSRFYCSPLQRAQEFAFPGGERLDAFVQRTHGAASRLAADSAEAAG